VFAEMKNEGGPMRKVYKRVALTAVMIIILVIVVLVSLKAYAAAPAKPAAQLWTPGCVSSVPRSWGQFKGGSAQSGLAFEDSAGTLRFLTNIPCGATPLVSLEIRRTADNPAN
jgi:hypothetical protein